MARLLELTDTPAPPPEPEPLPPGPYTLDHDMMRRAYIVGIGKAEYDVSADALHAVWTHFDIVFELKELIEVLWHEGKLKPCRA